MILGPTNLPSDAPYHASQMFSSNVVNVLRHLIREGALRFDLEDEITRESLVAHEKEVTNERIRTLLGMPTAVPA